MITIPYIHNFRLITLVPITELEKAKQAAIGLKAENAGLRADNDELLARLEERTQSHLHASARDVQTIQQQAVELSAVKAALSGRTVSCAACNESARTIDAMRATMQIIYDATEGCADGAPDASAHDKLCNEISSAIKPFLK
jgi:hypothetical protein